MHHCLAWSRAAAVDLAALCRLWTWDPDRWPDLEIPCIGGPSLRIPLIPAAQLAAGIRRQPLDRFRGVSIFARALSC